MCFLCFFYQVLLTSLTMCFLCFMCFLFFSIKLLSRPFSSCVFVMFLFFPTIFLSKLVDPLNNLSKYCSFVSFFSDSSNMALALSKYSFLSTSYLSLFFLSSSNSLCFAIFSILSNIAFAFLFPAGGILLAQRMLYNWCLIQSFWKFSFLRWIVIWSLFIALSQYYIKQMPQWLSGSCNIALSFLSEKKTHKTHKTHARHNIWSKNSKKTHKTHVSVIVWKLLLCLVYWRRKKHIKHVKHMHGIISEVWNKKNTQNT